MRRPITDSFDVWDETRPVSFRTRRKSHGVEDAIEVAVFPRGCKIDLATGILEDAEEPMRRGGGVVPRRTFTVRRRFRCAREELRFVSLRTRRSHGVGDALKSPSAPED